MAFFHLCFSDIFMLVLMMKECVSTYLFQILKSYGGDTTDIFHLW